MSDYVVLAVFAVILASLTLSAFRLIRYLGRACYQAFLPSAKQNSKADKRKVYRLSRRIESVPVPWGWAGFKLKVSQPAVMPVAADIRTPSVTPWGWPGAGRRQATGPQRNDGHPLAGKDLAASARLTRSYHTDVWNGFAGRRVQLNEARAPWGW